jgi:hypothetical protein
MGDGKLGVVAAVNLKRGERKGEEKGGGGGETKRKKTHRADDTTTNFGFATISGGFGVQMIGGHELLGESYEKHEKVEKTENTPCSPMWTLPSLSIKIFDIFLTPLRTFIVWVG